ncbi:DUF5778 family protein [Halobacteriaceae archaeon GCM10025711]
MDEAATEDLYERAAALLEPGDIHLHGAVIHTDLGSDEESMLHQATLDAGDVIAEHSVGEDWYVYSGNDDERFGVNQHQGLTIEGDEFVWECQQLLRGDTFDVVFYWEATDDITDVLDALREDGFEVVGVTEDGVVDRSD